MSSKSKIKGRLYENEIVEGLRSAGISAERVPGSGVFGGKYISDVAIPDVQNREFSGECKSRKDGTGFALIEKWLGNNDFLYLRRNHKESLVVMPFAVYTKLLAAYYKKNNNEN